jgi:hypothetical protein
VVPLDDNRPVPVEQHKPAPSQGPPAC